jgi:pSer/pThr/pTyr-binding forkhead associated (FHA) protein
LSNRFRIRILIFMANLFLVRYPDPPVLVPEKGKATIGRADTNTIVLVEPRVSRFHALIEYQYSLRKYAVSDLGSSNGTYVNGQRIHALAPRPVAEGDKIRIASNVFTVRFADDPGAINREYKELNSRIHLQATEFLAYSEITSAIAKPALSGHLEQLCAVELFQVLEYGKKTGVLTLKTDTGGGTFTFIKGNVISAAFETARDEKAVYEVLRCNRGTFSFAPRTDIAEKPRFRSSTSMLLMEGCRQLDEINIFPH